ncbi:hypothetical protein ACFWHT_10495 [Microbacterium sp. NPDC058342]|uniref:hypothetical protein n=1 Tax=Microbacterium sp. NPDC058342 TaxID=3346454 RepID=UPI003653F348
MVDPREDEENPDAPGIEVPDLDIPDAELPQLDVPDPVIPDPVIPESALAEPVIPPPPAEAPVTRADWREGWDEPSEASLTEPTSRRARAARPAEPARPAADVPQPATAAGDAAIEGRGVVPEPSLAQEDVVPPASGATPGSYRGWTVAIFGILLALLVGAVVTIATMLAQGVTPFPASQPAPVQTTIDLVG